MGQARIVSTLEYFDCFVRNHVRLDRRMVGASLCLDSCQTVTTRSDADQPANIVDQRAPRRKSYRKIEIQAVRRTL